MNAGKRSFARPSPRSGGFGGPFSGAGEIFFLARAGEAIGMPYLLRSPSINLSANSPLQPYWQWKARRADHQRIQVFC